MVSTTSQIERAYALLLLLFFASVAWAETAAIANDIPEPEDENINPVFMQDETIPGFLLKEDVGEARFLDIDIIPKCVLSCVYDRVLDFHCAHSDYLCVCNQITQIAAEEKFQSCFTDCNYLHDQNCELNNQISERGNRLMGTDAPGAILDFCGEVGVYIEFPPLLARFQHLHRRQSGFASGSLGPSDGGSASFPVETTYETTYTTLPWGNAAYTVTDDAGPDGIATVIVGIAQTVASSTAFVTETLASNAAGFTSTFTDLRSAVITEIIGLPAGQTPAPRSTTNTGSTNTNTGSSPNNTGTGTTSSGLSAGAKIGIGVAIPLIALAILATFLIGWFKFRDHRPGPHAGPMIQERDDGGLPEPVGPGWASGPAKYGVDRPVSQPPPAYHGPDAQSRVGAGGIPIHELNNNEGFGAQRGYGGARQEMSAIPTTPLHELGSKTPTLSPSSVARKPLSPTPSAPSVPAISQTSFTPPWDRTGEEEFAYSGPVAAAPKTEEELEVERMEQEMAQVKLRKQRLLDVQMLEEREEELRRKIRERRGTGGGGPSS